MKPFIKEGILYIPMIVQGDNIIGDAFLPINKDHPDYDYWYQLVLKYKDEE